MNTILLRIANLNATVQGKPILRGVTLRLRSGELHVLMGPNASGKTTLANVLAGSPDVTVTKGTVTFSRRNLLTLRPEERARAGLFLGFQHPVGIPGVSLADLLRVARRPAATKRPDELSAQKDLPAILTMLKLPLAFAERDLNADLSGGERKKSEIVQMVALQPKLAILDEPDSGVDVDACKLIARMVATQRRRGTAILLITHSQRITKFLSPDVVHVMVQGRIVRSGGVKLVAEIERKGYDHL